MKKKIILFIVIILIVVIGVEFYKINTGNERKKEIKVLLQKPKTNEVDKNKSDNDISTKGSNTNSNTNTNSIKDSSNNSYIISNDYNNDNKQNEKADKSIDFISSIKTDSSNNTSVNITNTNNNANSSNDDTTLLLARLIESEAGNEPYQGKLAVGSVVINRSVVDGESISSVIYKPGQFDGVNTSNFKIEPSQDSLKAAKEVLSGTDVEPDAYYFADLNLCSPEFAKTDTFIERIGGHWFFRK